MFSKEESQRYDRHIRLDEIGENGQQKLKEAKVLVVGTGGLGCPVLQYLSAAGVGEIGVMDADVVNLSNLQRQILFSSKDIGKQKTSIAVSVLSEQNELVKFNNYPYYLDKENALDLIAEYDIIVDCTDNFSARYLINDACVILGKSFVYGALHKFSGQVSVFNHNAGPTYRCLFPNPPKNNEIPNCSEVGVVGVLPSLIGTLQATEVLKIILGIGEVLSGKLLSYDTLQNSQQIIAFSKSDVKITELSEYDYSCKIANDNEILVAELQDWLKANKKFNLIDIREEYERDDYKLNDTHFIPMGKIMNSLNLLNKKIPTVLYCQTGNKSKAVVSMMKKQNFKEAYSLIGGVHQWVESEVNN